MNLLDLTLPTAAENLALDEALLLAAETGGPEVLRLWEWPRPAVVLGAAGKVREELRQTECRAAGVPILRRASGGGTVLLGAGCLVYTLILAYERAAELAQVRPSFHYILGRIQEGLATSAPGAELAGLSDLAIAGRKISGNSQQRKRGHLLHHGTLLYAFDIAQVARYLPEPVRQPDYRGRRKHAEFLCNVSTTREALRDAIRSAWGADRTLTSWPEDSVRRLVADKYACANWTYRR